jgi:5-methyltetrahydrofolate--homocysteine methyltransferase
MFDALYQSILTGDSDGAIAGVEKALDDGNDPNDILNQGMIAAMAEVGRRFEVQEYFIPEMLVAAKAMKDSLVVLQPHLVETGIEPIGKVVLGTVKGDLHDIGKNLVGMMLEGAGFEVVDLGTNVLPEQFVAAIGQHRPHFVGMSSLLTTTMLGMGKTIEALKEAGVRDQVKVMVGGAPVTPEFAQQIGADLFAPDAATAATRAKEMLEPV